MLYVNSSLLCILFGLGSLDYEAGSVEKFSTNENTLIITDFVISFSKLMSSHYQTYPDAKYVIVLYDVLFAYLGNQIFRLNSI